MRTAATAARDEVRRREYRVQLLGSGALGGTLVQLLEAGDVTGCSLAGVITSATTDSAVEALRGVDLLVEAAGATAARAWVPEAMADGVDVVLCSCGVLADEAFTRTLPSGPAAGRLFIPSGAIGGLDLFAAAARAVTASRSHAGEPHPAVTLTTTKSHAALGIAKSPRSEVFRGSARSAARTFPRTANVAVTLALATFGLDDVTVVVIADPEVTATRHVVTMISPLGSYALDITNTVVPGSTGRTSAVTAWSVVTLLESLSAGHGAGLLVTPGTGVLTESKDEVGN